MEFVNSKNHRVIGGIVFLSMCVFGNIYSAASSSSSSSSSSSGLTSDGTIEVNVAGHKVRFNRQVLLQMPFVQVMLDPQNIGNVYYGLDYDYLTASDQFSMGQLPRRRMLDKIVALAQKRDKIFLNLSPDQYRYFVLLYNMLSGIINRSINSKHELLTRIANSSLASPGNINRLMDVANKLFSSQAVANAFDLVESNILSETLKLSVTGEVSEAFFSPADQMEWVILNLIKNEKQSIRMACFLLNNPAIVRELAKAQQRGVRVSIVLDQRSRDGFAQLYNAGLPRCAWPVGRSQPMPLMHNKFFIFERNIFEQPILVTGSANCTISAQENNEENIIVTNDRGLIEQFAQRFTHLVSGSQCYRAERRRRVDTSSPDVEIKRFALQGDAVLQSIAQLYAQYVARGQAKMEALPEFMKPYVKRAIGYFSFMRK